MSALRVGDTAKDTISGFSGVVTAITEFLYGCRRVTITPNKTDAGKIRESAVFDEPQLTLLKRKTVPGDQRTGGDRAIPGRAPTPTRK